MELSVISEKNNPFMKRKEIIAEILHDGMATPSIAAVEELACQQFGAGMEKMDVRNIFSDHGMAKSRVKIFVWDEKKPEKRQAKNGKK